MFAYLRLCPNVKIKPSPLKQLLTFQNVLPRKKRGKVKAARKGNKKSQEAEQQIKNEMVSIVLFVLHETYTFK